jgi:hypothetical protein
LNANYKLLRIAGETAKFGGWSYDLSIILSPGQILYMISTKCREVILRTLRKGLIFYAPEWKDKITRYSGIALKRAFPMMKRWKSSPKWPKGLGPTTGEPVRDEQGKITKTLAHFRISLKAKRPKKNCAKRKTACGLS